MQFVEVLKKELVATEKARDKFIEDFSEVHQLFLTSIVKLGAYALSFIFTASRGE